IVVLLRRHQRVVTWSDVLRAAGFPALSTGTSTGASARSVLAVRAANPIATRMAPATSATTAILMCVFPSADRREELMTVASPSSQRRGGRWGPTVDADATHWTWPGASPPVLP